MRGYIKKRYKTGGYTIVVPLGRDPVTGKYKQHWETYKGTKVEAEKRLAELQTELFSGSFVKPQKQTVAEYLNFWLEDVAKPRIAPTTYKCYKYIISRHLIPELGSIPLPKLNGPTIQRYYSSKLKCPRQDGKQGDTISARTVQSHHRLLHKALKFAVTNGLIMHNATDNTEPPVPENKEIKPMTEGQLTTFLAKLKGSPYYELFYTALFTALRRSEILALRWEDIDLENGYLTVNRVMHYINGKFLFREPKTEKSKATISLTPSTIALLENYKQRRAGECLLLGIEFKASELAFCHADGSPILPNTITRYWQRFSRRIGIPGLRLHDARHTHATLMIKRGINLKVVQERLRHTRVETTLGLYTHVLPGMQEEAARLFDDYAPKQ